MAKRPVFLTAPAAPFFEERTVEFEWCAGLSAQQRKRSSENLRRAFLRGNVEKKVLEVSRFSDSVMGQKLSAFNLKITLPDGRIVPVENAFQSSKAFAGGGPFTDILAASPAEAKKDPRLQSSGSMTEFVYFGEIFPLEPKHFFYDWLYIKALQEAENEAIANQLMEYDAFTDIVFNPAKSFSCQARTVAIYVSLRRTGKLKEAMASQNAFRRIVFGEPVTGEEDLEGTVIGSLFQPEER